MLTVFPCGRTQHVRRMRSSIVSVMHSVLDFRTARYFICRVILPGRTFIFRET